MKLATKEKRRFSEGEAGLLLLGFVKTVGPTGKYDLSPLFQEITVDEWLALMKKKEANSRQRWTVSEV